MWIYLLSYNIYTFDFCVRDRSSRHRCCSSRLSSARCNRTSRSKCFCRHSPHCTCHRCAGIDPLQRINHRKQALAKCTASLSQRQLLPFSDALWLKPMKPATRRNANKFHLILTCCHSKVNFATASELTNCRQSSLAMFFLSSRQWITTRGSRFVAQLSVWRELNKKCDVIIDSLRGQPAWR